MRAAKIRREVCLLIPGDLYSAMKREPIRRMHLTTSGITNPKGHSKETRGQTETNHHDFGKRSGSVLSTLQKARKGLLFEIKEVL